MTDEEIRIIKDKFGFITEGDEEIFADEEMTQEEISFTDLLNLILSD